MSGDYEFSVDEILNRAFMSATRSLATGTLTGDGAPRDDLTPQQIWNRVYDDTNREIDLA